MGFGLMLAFGCEDHVRRVPLEDPDQLVPTIGPKAPSEMKTWREQPR